MIERKHSDESRKAAAILPLPWVWLIHFFLGRCKWPTRSYKEQFNVNAALLLRPGAASTSLHRDQSDLVPAWALSIEGGHQAFGQWTRVVWGNEAHASGAQVRVEFGHDIQHVQKIRMDCYALSWFDQDR